MARTRVTGMGQARCVVTSSYIQSMGALNSSGLTQGYLSLQPNQYSAPSTVVSIAAAYEFYRVRSCSVEFCPTLGSTQPGSVATAFVGSPQLQLAFATDGPGTRDSIIANTQNSKFYGANMSYIHTWQSNRVGGRVWYETGTSTRDEYADQSQFMFCWQGRGPDGDVLGSFLIRTTYEFSSLGSSIAASAPTLALAVSSGADPLIVPYDLREGGPKKVILTSPGLASIEYTPVQPPKSRRDDKAGEGNLRLSR